MKTNGHEIGRREFLRVSSACTLAAAAVGPRVFGAEVSAPVKRLAVGFASFEENAAVRSASSVPSGDGGFISRGARITVSGASGASADPRQRRGVELFAHFSYFEGAERRTTPFRAWGCSRATGCQGSPVSFTVPVDETQRLAFTVGVETGAPGGPASRRDVVSLDRTSSTGLALVLGLQHGDAVKMARGYYVIVPMFENDSEPRWSNWQLRRVDGRMALADAEGNVAPFEHFVLRIDYATL